MKLNAEQEQVIADWIHKKIEHLTCQHCQSTHWRVGELLLSPDRDPGSHCGSMVQVICQNCGGVSLFDANRIANWRSLDSLTDLM